MPVTVSVTAEVIANQSKTLDLSAPRGVITNRLQAALDNGTLDTQADRVWGDTRTLAASTTEDLDLAGVLIDQFGDPATFAEICCICITAPLTNTNDVVVGGAPSNAYVGAFGAATHTLKVRPGGCILHFAPAGHAVVAGTGDLLRVGNGGAGTPVDYSIIIVGRSA